MLIATRTTLTSNRLRVRPGASPTNDSDRNAIRFVAFFSSFGGGLRSEESGYPGPRIHTMEATEAGIPRVPEYSEYLEYPDVTLGTLM
jgi:hypothetical protein